MQNFNLHTHSIYSDGKSTPREIVEETIIYGSRARGTHRTGSDIDITLKGKSLTYLQLTLLDAEIYDLYLPYFIELSLFPMLKDSDLLESINREGKVLYCRQS